MTSVSEVVWKIWPLLESSCFQVSALMRLPLCAMAIGPSNMVSTSGWMFSIPEPPAVE